VLQEWRWAGRSAHGEVGQLLLHHPPVRLLVLPGFLGLHRPRIRKTLPTKKTQAATQIQYQSFHCPGASFAALCTAAACAPR
jgi:hypothetical protein